MNVAQFVLILSAAREDASTELSDKVQCLPRETEIQPGVSRDGDAGREQHFLSNNISAMAGPLRWERLNE
jgi:hypothetical protein